MEIQADEDDDHDGNHAPYGSDSDRNVTAIDEIAEDHGNQDEQQRHHGYLSIGGGSGLVQHTVHICGTEGAGYDSGESRHDQNQRQVREDDK